ncbi:MAG: hypothetical protein V2A34_03215 [Lentisphaerota bacterium]
MKDFLVLGLVIACIYMVVQVWHDLFGSKSKSLRFGVPYDKSLRIDVRKERKKRLIAEISLLIMIFFALIGAIIYLYGSS